jgi:hypothetical protein
MCIYIRSLSGPHSASFQSGSGIMSAVEFVQHQSDCILSLYRFDKVVTVITFHNYVCFISVIFDD